MFRIEDKYRLELHWTSVDYKVEGEANLNNAYFIGPVLQEVAQMNQNDSMRLDFKGQYIIMVPFYYVAVLSWRGVDQNLEKIKLHNAVLKNKYLNSVPKLKNDDRILIDTKMHDDVNHPYMLTYSAYLLKFDGELYKF